METLVRVAMVVVGFVFGRVVHAIWSFLNFMYWTKMAVQDWWREVY